MGQALGDLVVAKGIADQTTVARCLERQKQQARTGVFRRLGEILVEEGVLAAGQVSELLKLQGKSIRVCPVCIAQFNCDDELEARAATCTRCGVSLKIPERVERLQVEDDITLGDAKRALERASAQSGDSDRLAAIAGDKTRRFGPYEILGEISRGGMGIVYKARQQGFDRVVALKVLLSHGAPNQEAVRRFQREVKAVSRLRHPNIVAVHDVGIIDGVNYFSMDFIEGMTLDRAITAEGMDHRAVAELFTKVCDAVQYAHQQGVIHRDLKPRNILVDKRGEPVVIDFGIAKVDHTESQDGGGELTKSGEIMGSPAFLAPEYITGEVPVYDARADVWSLGACLYSGLSGRAPHSDADTIRIIRSATTAEAPPIRSIVRTMERSLAEIVMTSVDRNRANRYASARELGADLRRWLDGEEVSGHASPLSRWWRRARPKVAVFAGIATSITLVWTTGYYAKEIVRLREANDSTSPEFLRNASARKSARIGELLLDKGDAAGAERELSEAITMLASDRALQAHAFALRGQARHVLGREAESKADLAEAERIGKTVKKK